MPVPLPPATLDGVEMFRDLQPQDRARLLAELETQSLLRGDLLVRQGEPADALYVVLTGRFTVTLEGRADPVAELGPGQPVGEIAFITGGVRTATVRALRDSVVVRLGREQFDALLARHPEIWRALSMALARRVAEANLDRAPRPDPRPRTIALIRAGSSALPAAFVAALISVFRATAKVALIGAGHVRDVVPAPVDPTSTEATRALNELENAHDYVFFIADDTLTAWSEKAIRQADLVLAIGQHHSNATPNALEMRADALLQPEARRLILVHSKRETITDTARWLRQRRVSMHHHVAMSEPDDIRRVWRFVSGTAVGFVACGGGAYCAAHVGIFKALTEAGICFDIMGGTSGGAAMTAAFAMGSSPEEVDRGIDDIFVKNAAMRRYTVPRYSLLDHHHFDAQLARHYGGVAIEDLWIPYFAVSTDLSNFDLHRHRRGSVLSAVRATGSIPVLLPPYYTDEGHMLVDGALLDNVPVRVMRELKSGPNVVVSFQMPRLELFNVNYEDLPDRASLIRALLTPFGRKSLPPAPGLSTVLMRALMANRHGFERHLGRDDLLLVPPIPAGMGLLHWHRHSELMRLAHQWAADTLERQREAGHPILSGP